jgi:hypothetical protein
LTISSVELWISGKNSVYNEVPKVFAFSIEAPRTPFSLLPPVATALLLPLHPCRRCQHHISGHVLSLGRSPTPPPAPSYPTRRPQPERRSSFSSLALLRACHTIPRLSRRHLAATMALPVHAPSPSLLRFKSSTSSLSFCSTRSRVLQLPKAQNSLPPPSSSPASYWLPRSPHLEPSIAHPNPLGSFPVPH